MMKVACSVVVKRLVRAPQFFNFQLESVIFSLIDHFCSETPALDQTLNLVPVVFSIQSAYIVVVPVDLPGVFSGCHALFKSDCVPRVSVWVVYYVWEPHNFFRENGLLVEQFIKIISNFLSVYLTADVQKLCRLL